MIIHDIEQNSDEWLLLRSGMPTASSASKIITSTGRPSESLDGYAETLAGDLYAGEPIDAWQGNQYTDRGHEIEPLARQWYENEYFIDTEQLGFVTNDNETYGCSPDSRVTANKLLEIKCLPKKHIEILRYYAIKNIAHPKFYSQIQFQMLVCECDTTDLLFYHQKLPKLVITVNRDEVFIGKLEVQISKTIKARNDILAILNSY
jgi:YqaJ-like viral recombinase domain